jgi:hypothetical protein
MIREDRKNELRKLAYNQGLQETYYLINKQFERELTLHPPKDIEERVYDNKLKNYTINTVGDYVIYEIIHDYPDQSKMLPYLYVFPPKENKTKKYLDYLNSYISQILEHIYGVSRNKFICICGISFYVYRLSKTGSKIIGMEKYVKMKMYTIVYLAIICVF